MLSYSEIKPGKYIVVGGEPYEVVDANVFRKQQRKPVNAAKLKHLTTGKVIEQSFAASDKVQEADLERREVKYLFNNRGQWWFCPPDDPSNRFSYPEEFIGKAGAFMKENDSVELLVFIHDGEETVIGVKIPIKVDLEVVEAPPNVKGNTAQGGTKPVTLETGAVVTVPMFIEAGERIRVNTETGEYVERVS